MAKAQYKVLTPTTINGLPYERGEEVILDDKAARSFVDAGEIQFSRSVDQIKPEKERAADRDEIRYDRTAPAVKEESEEDDSDSDDSDEDDSEETTDENSGETPTDGTGTDSVVETEHTAPVQGSSAPRRSIFGGRRGGTESKSE